MSPDAVVGLLHLADRFGVMVGYLLHQPQPPLPPTPGRVHRLPEPLSVEADAELRDKESQAAIVWIELASDNEGADLD